MYAPAKTPIKDENIRAKQEPIKTGIYELDLAARSIVAN